MGCNNRLLGVDFDGCCVVDNFPNPIVTMPWAVPVLKELVKRGWGLVLWTCRQNHGPGEQAYLDHAIGWFEENGLPLIGVNEVPVKSRPYPYVQPSPKIWTQYYIDDAIPGGFQGWLEIFRLIEGEEFHAEQA